MSSRASSSTGPNGAGGAPKRVVKIASMTSTKSANHQQTTTTTTFDANGSASTSVHQPPPQPRPRVTQPSPAPPAASSRAGGSSSYVVRPGQPSSRPSAAPEAGPSSAASPSTSALASSASATAAGDKPVVVHVGKGKNSIIVNARQRGNPIMNHIKNVAWEYGDIVPDYVVGQHTCVLYLSLRYHRLHPEYLHQRIEKLAAMYQLRVLLVMCDVSDHQDPIREISKICIINNLTVMVCWTPEEAGLYLATYKIYEHKPPDILKEKIHNDYRSYLNRSLTGIKGVNKTDVLTLSSSFGSFDRIIHSTPEELSVCPGVGETKVRRLLEAFTGKFRGGGGGGAGRPSVDGGVDAVAGTKGKGKAVEADEAMGGGEDAAAAGTGEEEGADETREFSPDWPDEDEEDAEAEVEAEGEPPRKKRLVTDSP